MSVRRDPVRPPTPEPSAPALPAWAAALVQPVAWRQVLVSARGAEVAGWGAVFGAAATLRLAALSDLPLGPDEGAVAMDAWRLWLGRGPTELSGAALLTHALLLVFGLFGASDFAARLVPALAGLALVGAPLLFRPLLGPVGALGAGALLALSPLAVFGSRQVDSAICVAAFLALLVGACARVTLAQPAPVRPPAAAYAVPVLAALLWAAGSVVLPAVLAVLGAAAITWWPGAGAPNGAAPPPRRFALPVAWPLAPALTLVLFAGTLALVGTAALTHLRGLQVALVDPWVSWLAPYLPHPQPIPWLPALLLYDLPLVATALVGVVIVVRRNRPFEHFLLWWLTLAAVPLVFQPADPRPFLIVWLVPLALLGGTALAALPTLGWTWRDGGKDALLAVLLAIDACFVVNTLRLLLSGAAAPGALGGRGRDLALSLVAALVLVGVHWQLAAWWREALRDVPGGARLTRVGVLGLLALGVTFTVLANDRLQFGREGAGEAELVRPDALAPSVYELVEELKTWARQAPNEPIYVGAALRSYLLWHLRDVAPVEFRERPPAPGTTAAIVGRRGVWPAGSAAPPGEQQPLRTSVAIGPIPSTSALWNWWLYRNAWLVPTRHDIIVVR